MRPKRRLPGAGPVLATVSACVFATCTSSSAIVSDAGAGVPDAGAIAGESVHPRKKRVLVGAGDIADCNTLDDEKTGALVERILAADRDALAFTAGDNAYPDGSPSDYARCYTPAWGSFKARTLAVPGNHDYHTKNAAGFASYFGLAADQPFWRSVDVGAWHIVLLDSNCPPPGRTGSPNEPVECGRDSPQARWLEEDLRKSGAKCTALIWHHARFSSGSHGNDPRMQALWEIAERHGADLVIQGHDHTYERFQPLTSTGEVKPTGIASFVVGTGGRFAYPFRAHAAGSLVRESGSPGVLVLELEEGLARFRFVRIDGSIGDQGTILCR